MKFCSRCNKNKSFDKFHLDTRTKDGYRSNCKDCRVELSREDYVKDPRRYRDVQLKRHYGINIEEYEKLIRDNNGKCAICKRECSTKRKLCVDHCHVKNKVRGLLCNSCNQGLGKFEDSVEFLIEAIKYLREFDVRTN